MAKEVGKVWERISHGANIAATAPVVLSNAAAAYDSVVNHIQPATWESTLKSPDLVPGLIATAIVVGAPAVLSIASYYKAKSRRENDPQFGYILRLKNSRMSERARAFFEGGIALANGLNSLASFEAHQLGGAVVSGVIGTAFGILSLHHAGAAHVETEEINYQQTQGIYSR